MTGIIPTTRNASACKPRFQGALLTRACQSRWVQEDELVRLLKRDNNPFIGSLPQELIQASGHAQTTWLNWLDQFADQCRQSYSAALTLEGRNQHCFTHHPALKNTTLDYVSQGAVGKVFRLKTGDKSYAVKIIRDKDFLYKRYLGLGEMTNGPLFRALNISDIAAFYCGNPDKGWIVSEYIPHRSEAIYARREGPTYRSLNLAFGDDGPKNRIQDIRVDHGYLDISPRRKLNLTHRPLTPVMEQFPGYPQGLMSRLGLWFQKTLLRR